MSTTSLFRFVQTRFLTGWLVALALLIWSGMLGAQTVTVVDLPPVSAKSAMTFASVLNVVELPDGQLAVNDATARQLIYLDRTLSTKRIILDSTLSPAPYGRSPHALILCNCQEVWFPDLVSQSILTFDHTGKQKRVMAAPNASDLILMMTARALGDSIGHLFYLGHAPRPIMPGRPSTGTVVENQDSIHLLRADFATRKVDTIANLRSLRTWMMYVGARGADGKVPPTHIAVDILASIDEWTSLPDGTVAIVRGHDYHIDWLLPSGKAVASPKLPFDFKRLTDADKAALMDSARKAELVKRREEYDKTRARGVVQTSEVSRAAGSGGAGGFASPEAPMTAKVGEYVEPIVDPVPFDRMPDYYPPIRNGAVTSDLDGNVWILPTTSAQSRAGELVYDVVSRDRGLISRVRLPIGRSLGGFGRNGNVYLLSRDVQGRWTVERSALPKKL